MLSYLGRILYMAWAARNQGPEGRQKPKLTWEKLSASFFSSTIVERAKVPGGWLVMARTQMSYGVSVSFYPDPTHEWDGGSLP